MEKIPQGMDKRREVGLLINSLRAKAPEEASMQTLTQNLHQALAAAQEESMQGIADAMKSAYGNCNALGAKNIDVLLEVEEIADKIKELGR